MPTKPAAQSERKTAPELTAAIDLLWTRFQPEIRKRVDLLDLAVAASAAGRLTAEERETAHGAAHKLAGTLGIFDLDRGTVLAREFELITEREDKFDSTAAGRMASIAAELRNLIENRK